MSVRWCFNRTLFLWTILRLVAINSIKEVCYPEIGHFSLDPPWTDMWRPKPKSPDGLGIGFYVITRNTLTEPETAWKVEITETYRPVFGYLQDTDYQRERPMTVFQIYGYTNSEARKWNRIKAMADAYLFKRDVNVIFIDWDSNGRKHGYRECVSNTRTVAAVAIKYVAILSAPDDLNYKFIKSMIKYHGLTSDRIHLIGFSLGAHIAGYIGKDIRNIHRITALDAAQPGFESYDQRIRLHSGDARHVDALHTNARPFFQSAGLGYMGPIGHVDFYFNGGGHQPGCWKPEDDEMEDFHFRVSYWNPRRLGSLLVYATLRCSHYRSIDYWLEALKSTDCVMWGVRRVQHRPEDGGVQAPETELRPTYYRKLGRRLSSLRKRFNNRDMRRTVDGIPVGLDTFSTVALEGIFHVKTNARKPFCRQFSNSAP